MMEEKNLLIDLATIEDARVHNPAELEKIFDRAIETVRTGWSFTIITHKGDGIVPLQIMTTLEEIEEWFDRYR